MSAPSTDTSSGSESSSSSPDASSQSSAAFFDIKLVPVQDSPQSSATRAHFRSSKVMEFEGRKDVRQVWLCDAAPSSPFSEIPPAHHHSAGRSESSEPTSHTQESGSPTTSHLRLGQRPALIHSETVPDVHVADVKSRKTIHVSDSS